MRILQCLSFILFSVSFLISCQPAKMLLPSDLQQNTLVWPVKDRRLFFNESFVFGPFNLTDVHRGWINTSSWGIGTGSGMFRDSEATQKYEFKIAAQDALPWHVQCIAGAEWTEIDVEQFLSKRASLEWGLSFKSSLACSIGERDSSSRKSWRLLLKGTESDSVHTGVLSEGTLSIVVQGTRKVLGTSIQLNEESGYFFVKDAQLIGAVEVLNDGQVWIKEGQSMEMQQSLAAASAALLLYRDITD